MRDFKLYIDFLIRTSTGLIPTLTKIVDILAYPLILNNALNVLLYATFNLFILFAANGTDISHGL